jgi:hypothetical protein
MSSSSFLLCIFINLENICKRKNSESGIEVAYPSLWVVGYVIEDLMEEYQSIMKHDVWEIVPSCKGKFVVTSKWFYNIKHVVDGSINKYKERFVARGFSQRKGEDHDETFAPVARYTSIRAIISLAASMGWSLHHMDVKITLINGVIEEEVYIELGMHELMVT